MNCMVVNHLVFPMTIYLIEFLFFKVLWQKIDRTNQGTNETNGEQLTLIAFDGIVYSNKDHYRLESDYVGSYNLIIDRVNEDDQGEYQCQINTEPRKTKRIFLTVQGITSICVLTKNKFNL